MNSEARERDIVERLRNHALPDPHDEREVLHAPLLKEAANEITRLRAALSTEAQPELTGAVAQLEPIGYIDREQLKRWDILRGTEFKVAERAYIPFSKSPFKSEFTDCTLPVYAEPSPSTIQAAVREKLEAVKERDRLGYAVVQLVEAVDALLEAGSDEYLHDENGDFTYEEAPSDCWADLRTAADNMVLRAEDFEEKYRAIAAPQPSAIEAAVREKLEEAAKDLESYGVPMTASLAASIVRALMESPHTSVEEPAN